jgi:transcriptional antiterminator Rof (Rho-off)
MHNYQPISCSLYDELELLAMRGLKVQLLLNSGETLSDTFVTFESRKHKGEFAILKSGGEIRLDELVLVDGKDFRHPSC